jgi:hypothetical protein
MKKRTSAFLALGAMAALQLPFAENAIAADDDPDAFVEQSSEDRWIPSLAIVSGVVWSDQKASSDTFLFQGMSDPTPPCAAIDPRPECRDLMASPASVDGDDRAVVPFVGATIELMSPALPIPSRPRVFVSAEMLAAFASDRDIALQGNTGCIRGPAADAPCAADHDPTDRPFGQESLVGVGTRTTAKIGNYMFGVNLGMAFPVQLGERQLRIKPSVGWFNYEVKAKGKFVQGFCDPENQCVDFLSQQGVRTEGFLRDFTYSGTDKKRFNGIGPGLDIEVDTGRSGPIGSAIFIGGRAYRILGDRKISFSGRQTADDVFGADTSVTDFEVKVDPWMFRAHVGVRFQWLGQQQSMP